MHAFEAGPLGGIFDRKPDDFVVDVLTGRVPHAAGEQSYLRLASQPPPVSAQLLEQRCAEHHIAVLAAFPALDMDHHALAVDIADLQAGQFGPAHTGRVKRQQDHAVERVARIVDQLRNLFACKNRRLFERPLRIWRISRGPWPSERSHEKEPERAGSHVYRVGRELPFTQQIRLVLTHMLRSQLVRRPLKYAEKSFIAWM